MDALRVWWVLLGILGAGSAQLQLQKFGSILMDTCNSTVIIPCIVTNLQLNDTRAMYVKWRLGGNEFFSFDGFEQPVKIQRNSTFQSAEFVSLSKLPFGTASLSLSRKEAIPGNYSCEVTESNREGISTVELKQAIGAAARCRALAPPREPLEGPIQGQEAEISSGGDSVSPAEERGEAAAPHQSSSSSMEERPVEASQGPGPSGMAAAGHQPQQQHCNCFQLLAHMDRRMARMGRRLAAVEQRLQVLEQRQVAGDRSPPPPTEQPLVLSSGPGSGTQQAASSSTSGSTTPVPSDLEEASTVPASLPSSAPGAPPEAPQWGGPAPHLAGLPSSSEDTP